MLDSTTPTWIDVESLAFASAILTHSPVTVKEAALYTTILEHLLSQSEYPLLTKSTLIGPAHEIQGA